MEPNGKLNAATYRLIGKIYEQFERYETYARPSTPLVEAAVMTNENPLYENRLSPALLGTVQLLEECALQFDIVDRKMDLTGYRLVILPDDVEYTPDLVSKLEHYVAAGGKLLAAGGQGDYPLCFCTTHKGKQPCYPDFIEAEGCLADGLEPETNMWSTNRENCWSPVPGAQVLLRTHSPYFPRQGTRFCSHLYTPSAKTAGAPAAIATSQTILFAHPLFSQYRACAPLWCKILIKNALHLLLGKQLVTHNGPSTVTVSLLQKGETCYAHLLSYIPVRKCTDFDIIEERTQVSNLQLTLNLPNGLTEAKLVPSGMPLPVQDNTVTIPTVDGYAIVALS